jgi:hypothetical protein
MSYYMHDLPLLNLPEPVKVLAITEKLSKSKAEALVVQLFGQLLGGLDQRPQYLASGAKGLTSIDRAAINRILNRAGMQLRSRATSSERKVAVRLAADRVVEHTLFWLQAITSSGGEAPDDEAEEASVEATVPPLALPA